MATHKAGFYSALSLVASNWLVLVSVTGCICHRTGELTRGMSTVLVELIGWTVLQWGGGSAHFPDLPGLQLVVDRNMDIDLPVGLTCPSNDMGDVRSV